MRFNFCVIPAMLFLLAACGDPEVELFTVKNETDKVLALSAVFRGSEGRKTQELSLNPGQQDGWHFVEGEHNTVESFQALSVRSPSCVVIFDKTKLARSIQKQGGYTLVLDDKNYGCP